MTETRKKIFNAARLAAYLLIGLALMVYYNLLPWRAPASAASLADMAFAECINNAHGVLNFSCRNAGLPYGDPSTFGLPVQMVIAALCRWLSLPPIVALRAGYAIFIGVALLGATRLFSRFTQHGNIALFCGFLFMVSPIVVFEGSYGPLRAAFALLPTYILIHISAMEAASDPETSGRSLALWLAALGLTNTFAIFCDGYSFVMLLLVAGLVWAGWLLDRIKNFSLRDAKISAGVLASVIFAVAAYRAYLPISSLDAMPLDFFRGQGIDLYFFAVPSDYLWLARITGLHHHISPNQVYSDGPSSTIVYVGYGAIGCMIAALCLLRKGLTREISYLKWLLLGGVIAFIFSLGPTLKIHDFNPSPSSGFSFSTYLMPEGNGTLDLHTGWIYQKVPGINFMRALYRWQLVVRLVLLISIAIVLDYLARQRKFALIGFVALILFLETLPAVHLLDGNGKRSFKTITEIQESTIPELRANIPPHSKTLFIQLHPNPSRNEYLASYFCAAADLRCYNVGGDKGTLLSARFWPAPVYELINGISISENARRVLDTGLADVIVVPMFDLRLQAYYWPDNNFPIRETRARVKKIFGDGYSVTMTRWFAFVRAEQQTRASQKENLPTTSGPALPIVEVISWGPLSLPSHPPAGQYLWIKVKAVPDDDLSIVIDDHVLPTLKKESDHVIAAEIRNGTDGEILRAPGAHKVYLLDRKTNIRQSIGTIRIQD